VQDKGTVMKSIQMMRRAVAIGFALGIVACSESPPPPSDTSDAAPGVAAVTDNQNAASVGLVSLSDPFSTTATAENNEPDEMDVTGAMTEIYKAQPEDVLAESESVAEDSLVDEGADTELATTENNPQLGVSGDASALYWDAPEFNYDHLQLRLSGPGNIIVEQRFSSSELAMVSRDLPDGLYKWETYVAPDIPESVRTRMRAVREAGDLNAERALISELRGQGYLPSEQQAQANVKSGHFRIYEGEIVRQDIVE